MHIEIDCPDHGIVVESLLEGCVLAACAIVEAGVVPPFPTDIPSLRFIPESAGSEKWLLPHQVMRAGGGDCEDLAIWTAAGYRVTGTDPGATCRVMQTGKSTLHCIVQRSDGAFEDPALVLRRRDRRPNAAATLTEQSSTQPVMGAPHELIIRDQRGKGAPADWASAPAAAANPNPKATPQAAAVAKYMAEHGLSSLRISPTATQWRAQLPGGEKGDVLAPMHPQYDAINNLVYEKPSNPAAEGFGRSRRADGSDVVPFDDGAGGIYWGRPSAADLAQLDPYGPYADGNQSYGFDPYSQYGYGGYGADDAWAEYRYMQLAMQPAYRYGYDEGYGGYGSSYERPALTYADLYLDDGAMDDGAAMDGIDAMDDGAAMDGMVIDTTATEMPAQDAGAAAS